MLVVVVVFWSVLVVVISLYKPEYIRVCLCVYFYFSIVIGWNSIWAIERESQRERERERETIVL